MSADPILGLYQASVANNQDPLNQARVTLLIPQVLGDAESAWAVPASPTNTIPPVGQTVWVQFSGGDITKPVYSPLGIKAVQDQVASGSELDTLPPKEPTALNLTTVQFVTNEGITLARVTATWTPPTENQDGTNLTDLAHYVLQYSYDGTTWLGGTVTEDTLVVIDGLHTGVDVTVRVQAVDTSNNVSLWATSSITTASSTTPPPVPSTPVVLGVLGGLRVTWDGLDSTGAAMPAIFDHVQVQRDTNNTFPSPVTVATLSGADFTFDSIQNYAAAYYYRLVAYSKVGIASAPSGYASDTPKQAVNQDLVDHAISEVKIQTGGLDASQVLKTGTITAASGIIGSINAATITVGQIQGSQIAAHQVTADHMAAGTITAESGVIASLDASKITVGKVTASQIDATSLVISGGNVSGQVSSAASAGSATTVTGSLGAGVSVPGTQVTGTVPAASSSTTVTGSIGAGVSVPAGQLSNGTIPTTTTINGGSITTGTIDASKATITNLNASNISTGTLSASVIGSRSITTDKMVIGDTSNIILDPQFTQNSSSWGWNSNVVRTASSDASVPTGAPALWVAKLTNQTSSNTDLTWKHTATTPPGMPVNPGETYYVEAWVVANGASNANLRFFLSTWDASGNNISWPGTASIAPSSATTWTKIVGQITIPSGKYLAAFGIGSLATTPTTAAGNWFITNVKMRKAIDNALVVAGSITTDKLDANAINGMTISGVTISGQTINGGTINGSTITGGTLTSGASGSPQVNITASNNSGVINFPTHSSSEFGAAYLISSVGNKGLANEYSTFQIQGPTVSSRRTAQVLAQFNSPNSDGSSNPNFQLWASTLSGIGTQVVAADCTKFAVGVPVVNNGETWTTIAAFTTGWGQATTFSGVSPVEPVKFRKDAEDNVWIYGALTVTSSSAGSVGFSLPSGYYNTVAQSGFMVPVKPSSGSMFTAWFYVSTTGNAHFDLGAGFTHNVGDTIFINGRIPLGNIA